MKRTSQTCCLAWLLLAAFCSSAQTKYVNLNNLSPAAPYLSWDTAATNIQDAVNAASPGDRILVTNGVYRTGGRAAYDCWLTNRVTVDKDLTVESVNGPEVTVIEGYRVPGTISGYEAVRCVYLTATAALVGFTLTNGATGVGRDDDRNGGGVWRLGYRRLGR